MYRSILVPLDGSERAETILPHVEELARCLQARIVLLQVVEPPPGLVSPYEMILEVEDDTEERLQEAAEYLTLRRNELAAKGIRVDSCVETGAIVRTIIEVSERESVDLIALASHGRTAMFQVFYGSVASGVLAEVDRPLLVVRAQ
jgi:nucleotide-binding universal stress UspA family protein